MNFEIKGQWSFHKICLINYGKFKQNCSIRKKIFKKTKYPNECDLL